MVPLHAGHRPRGWQLRSQHEHAVLLSRAFTWLTVGRPNVFVVACGLSMASTRRVGCLEGSDDVCHFISLPSAFWSCCVFELLLP